MYLEDRLYSEYEDEVYYSVVLDEDELRLYSEFFEQRIYMKPELMAGQNLIYGESYQSPYYTLSAYQSKSPVALTDASAKTAVQLENINKMSREGGRLTPKRLKMIENGKKYRKGINDTLTHSGNFKSGLKFALKKLR